MADPRAFTVVCARKEPGKSSNRRSFFNTVGKVGDLAVLNDIGASKIGKGLRTLASVSNTIRTGCGALPTSIGSSLEKGANWVLENTGISPAVVGALGKLRPEIANQAYGQAKQIFQKVKQGNFKLADIPGSLQDLQNLERLGRNIFAPTTAEQRSIEMCGGISPYAIDLINRAPKYKFLFVVQFKFNDPYGPMGNQHFAFVVKNTTRPSLKINMDDANYYNFRTKIITRTTFEPMSMTFHEDTGFGRTANSVDAAGEQGNYALRFYNAYMRATAPITNKSDISELALALEDGMDFSSYDDMDNIEAGMRAPNYAASYAPPTPAEGGAAPSSIIQEIRVFHVYNFGHSMNVYKFMNPRISKLALDALDMSISTEGSEMSMDFEYDSVYIDTGIPMGDKSGEYNIEQLQPGALYPLRYNASSSGDPLSPRDIKPFGAPVAVSSACGTSTNTKSPPPIR